jgi:PAS domain S-box-containing protein
LVLSLAPLVIIGMIAYKNGEKAIKKSLGSTFQQTAHIIIDKVDRYLYEVYYSVQAWAELELMQEVITGDVDGKISSFLMELSKEYGYFSMINALNSEGEVVASSNPELIGRDFSQKDFYKVAFAGKAYVGDVQLDKISKMWVVIFSFPIKAKFEEDKIIGALCANWNTDELLAMTQLQEKEGEEEYHTHVMLMRGDGLVISAPEIEKEDVFKRNLIKAGLKSALLASQKKEGYLVEIDEHNRKSLIGYDYSRGHRDFTGLGWSTLVIEYTKRVFAPIERLKIIIFAIGTGVALFVIIISLIVTRKMTNPILKISQVASRVAQGDFEGKIEYTSNDEIGSLAKSFNQMIQDLREQRAQLVDRGYVDSIIANMIDTLIVVDPEGVIKTVNKATCDFLGYKEEELIGKDVNPLILEGAKEQTILRKFIKQGGLRNYETSYKTKDGKKIPVLLSGSILKRIVCPHKDVAKDCPVLKEKGKHCEKILGVVYIARDITERKKTEEQQRVLMKDLEETNRIMTGRELRMVELKREIDELLKEKGQKPKYEVE